MNPWSLSLCETAKERSDSPEDEVGGVEESLILLGVAELLLLLLLFYCDVVPHSTILPKIFMLSIAASRCLPPTLSK
jgi:hypothetical protein